MCLELEDQYSATVTKLEQMLDKPWVGIVIHSLVFLIILTIMAGFLYLFTASINSLRDVSTPVNLTKFFARLDLLNFLIHFPVVVINSLFFDIIPTNFRMNFLQRALFAGIIVSVVAAVIGTFVLLRGLVFLGQAIAHSAFAGAALAILLGELFLYLGLQNQLTLLFSTPVIMISIFSMLSALGIGYVNEKDVMKNEVIVGIVFSAFMALAVLFIGLLLTYSTEINSILFGNLLLISELDFRIMFWISLLITITLLAFKKEFYFITFDAELAKLSGIPVRFLQYLFLVLVALTISVTLQAIGAILVFAMLITPAAAAYQWTFRLNRLLVLSTVFGIFSNFMGLYLSYVIDLPSSSTIVLVITLIFVYSFILSPKRRDSGTEGELCSYCGRYVKDKPNYCADDGISVPHKHVDDRIVIKKQDLEDPTDGDSS